MDSASIATQLQQLRQNAPNAADLYNQAVNQFGIPEVRNRVTGLRTTLANTESALNNVAPSVAARSQGSLVTGGQQSALANLERQPLTQQYGQEQTALGNESTNLNDLLSQATNSANMNYKNYQDKVSGLESQYTLANQREQAARDEAYRQAVFAEQKAQSARAAAGSGGLGDLSSLFNTAATSSPPAAPAGAQFAHFANDPNPYNWYNFLNDANKTHFGGKANYGQLADWAEKAVGSKIGNASAGDLALRNIFLHTPLDPAQAKKQGYYSGPATDLNGNRL